MPWNCSTQTFMTIVLKELTFVGDADEDSEEEVGQSGPTGIDGKELDDDDDESEEKNEEWKYHDWVSKKFLAIFTSNTQKTKIILLGVVKRR